MKAITLTLTEEQVEFLLECIHLAEQEFAVGRAESQKFHELDDAIQKQLPESD